MTVWGKKVRFLRQTQGKYGEDLGGEQWRVRTQSYGTKTWALANLRENAPYRIGETGEQVYVSRPGIKEVTTHGEHEEAHLLSIGHIPAMLEEAKFIGEMENYKGKGMYPLYRYYRTPLKISGEDYTARIIVGVKDGTSYYNHVLTEIERGDLLDVVARITKPGRTQADLQKEGEAILPSRLKGTTFMTTLQKWLSGETPESGVIPQKQSVSRREWRLRR